MSRSAARRWLATAAFCFVLFALAPFAASDDGTAGDFDALLEPIRVHYDVPALAAILLHGERVAGIGAVGYRKIGEVPPVTRDDSWHLGSIGKSMTATMIARLVERGIIGLDTTVGQALGDALPDMHTAYRRVTVEQLLLHRAGTVGQMKSLDIWTGKLWRSVKAKAGIRLDIAREALARAPEAPPGEAFHYSNAGYVIAGGFGAPGTAEKLD